MHGRSRLGEGVTLEPGSVIGPDVVLGRRCRVGANAVIYGPTVMGDDNRVHAGAVIGGDPQDTLYRGQVTRLEIGHRNVFRESVTVSRGSPKGNALTRIGDDNYLMAGAHVAHDVVLENQCILANGALIAGHCHIESWVNFAGGTAMVQFTTVGRLVFLGGLAGTRRDLEPFIIHDRTTHDSMIRPIGVNKVALRRAKISEGVIDRLKLAFKVLFCKEPASLVESRAIIRQRGGLCAEVEELVDFIHRKRSGRYGRQLERPVTA